MRLIIFLILPCLGSGLKWWVYDEYKERVEDMNSDPKFDVECGDISDRIVSNRLTLPESEKYKLWPGVLSKRDLLHGETMVGFQQSLEAVWANQHPVDCSKAKFYIAGPWEEGFGSEIHVIGVGLGIALSMNRVFIWNKKQPVNKWQVNTEHCRNQNNTVNLECYYEPMTHCTPDDILGGTGRTIQDLYPHGKKYIEIAREIKDVDAFNPTYRANERVIHANINALIMGKKARYVPFPLQKLVRCWTKIRDEHAHYFWRVISTAYMLRPNAATVALLEKHRRDRTVKFDVKSETCIAMYVRRGDKAGEMKPVELRHYFKAAQEIWERNIQPRFKNPGKRLRAPVLFIGSEEPSVIEKAIEWGNSMQPQWKVLYTDLFDRSTVQAHLNFTTQKALKNANKQQHHDLEYFSMILNLDSFLKCHGFVCTQGSNFCRVLDELRASVANKANRELVDMEIFTGRYPKGTVTELLGW